MRRAILWFFWDVVLPIVVAATVATLVTHYLPDGVFTIVGWFR